MGTVKAFALYDKTCLFPKPKTSETFARNVLEFQKICGLYKSILDRNLGGTFCLNGHCRTIFMVEITLDGSQWGATPKMFDTEAAAQNEAKILKMKYSFLSGCRVITRKLEENSKPLAVRP